MKYGRLVMGGSTQNIGDNAQIKGIDLIYEKMNIPKENIVNIYRHMLRNYDGDYVLLPIFGVIENMGWGKHFPISDRIIPVFLSMHCTEPADLRYFELYRRYEPIGCRDEATMRLLRSMNINSYLLGCISLLLPKRECMPKEGKVFICEVSNLLSEYIPEHIAQNAIYLDPQYVMYKGFTLEESVEASYKDWESKCSSLCNEASLVITSRMHIASPCVAMGIPVVLARDFTDERFEGLDKIMPVHNMYQYKNIDWDPKPIDIEWLKDDIMSLAIEAIQTTYNKHAKFVKISSFYENRKKNRHIAFNVYNAYLKPNQAKDFSKNNRDVFFYELTGKLPEETNIILFGAGSVGRMFYENMYYIFKRCKSVVFMDNNSNIQNTYFGNVLVNDPVKLKEFSMKDTVIFITTTGLNSGNAACIAQQLSEDFNLQEGVNYFLVESVYNTALQLCTFGSYAKSYEHVSTVSAIRQNSVIREK